MKKKKILLIGGGGHCKAAIDVIELTEKFEIVGIIDKKENLGKKILGYEIIGTEENLNEMSREFSVLITIGHIGNSQRRVELYRLIKSLGFIMENVISPLAYISKYATLGEGNLIMHHALINAGAKVGNNCIINSKSLIEHDAVIEDHCHISTGAIVNGGVIVREGTFFGSNATSKQNSVIEGFIKAGSVVK